MKSVLDWTICSMSARLMRHFQGGYDRPINLYGVRSLAMPNRLIKCIIFNFSIVSTTAWRICTYKIVVQISSWVSIKNI